MTTHKQAEANRQNAKNSTGPRTAEGKKNSSMNALKWGLSSHDGAVVLPTESREEFEAFRAALLADLEPVGAIEEGLARIVVEEFWRIRRGATIERGVLAHGVADADQRYLAELKRKFEITEGDVTKVKFADKGIRHSEEVVEITNLELHEEAELAIYEALEVKREDEARLASGFIEDAAGANAMAKLSRYETTHFRQLSQALAGLRELQGARSKDTK